MVVFGLFGSKVNLNSNNIMDFEKEKDVLGELMDLDNVNINYNKDNELDTSSLIIEDIINQLSTKSNVKYKDALINSLYAQVEFLKNDSLNKNKIIESLIINNVSQNRMDTENKLRNSTFNNSNNSEESLSNVGENPNCASETSRETSRVITDSSEIVENGEKIDIDDQLREIRELKKYEYYSNTTDESFATWEQYSSGFGRKMLRKMGFRGGGIGKYENGITEPIIVENIHGREALGANVTDIPSQEKSARINRGLGNLLTNRSTHGDRTSRNRITSEVYPWPVNTTLITGSSILSGVDENRLSNYRAKVRVFPGACVSDMYHYLMPLLKKNPTNIILHIGSNDAPRKTADEIENEIMILKQFIVNNLPNVKVFVSCPTVRFDNARANAVLRDLNNRLKLLPDIIINDNIDNACIGKKGLHLNKKGSGRLAINYISLMRHL